MTRILLTGFGPFDGAVANPSCEIARALDGLCASDFEIVGKVLLEGAEATYIDDLTNVALQGRCNVASIPVDRLDLTVEDGGVGAGL